MSRDKFTASSYHKLSAAQKQAMSLAMVRDRPLRCRHCDTQVMPADMVAHLEQRCAGRPEPGPGAKWVSARDAIVRRVPKQTLSYWVARGFVRARGPRMDREYLLEDLALKISLWRGLRRRSSEVLDDIGLATRPHK